MSSDEDSDNGDDVEDAAKYRTTTSVDRFAIFMTCRSTMVNGRVKKGIQIALANQLGISRVTVSRQWTAINTKLAPLLSNHADDTHQKIIRDNHDFLFGDAKSARRAGKHKYDRGVLKEAMKVIAFKGRRSVRRLAFKMGIPLVTVHRYIHPRNPNEEPLIKRFISKLKPTLTEKNKEARYIFALDQINNATAHLVRPKFLDMMDRVHIDEKWFHMCQDGEGYLLVAGEEEPPERHVKHKGYIGKVMFLCAQARPRWDPHTKTQWDGKIGLWPIGKYTVAQRNSKHRPAGTTEWDNENVDHEVYRDMMINLVFTEIMNKWPVGQWNNPNFRIRIQQDGAGGHTKFDDAYLTQALEDLGLTDKVSIYTQPPNSPDLNILDLGLFNALQAAYYDNAPKNEVELIAMVEQTYADYPYLQINRLFVTLQTIFNCIIEHHGGNHFKIPHMNKARLEREDRLPVAVQCTALPR
jgi:hypothetical protein